MNFQDCLDNAARDGAISKENAEFLKRRYSDFQKKFASQGSMADSAAAKALSDLMKAETAHQRKKAKLAIKITKKVDYALRNHKNARGEHDIAEGARMLFEHFGEAQFSSVAGRQKAITGMAHAKMDSMMFHFRRHWLLGDKGRWNAAQLDNVAREAFGEATGDAQAKEFARIWETVHEELRNMFNAAGGAIGKLERWGLPQSHDARALRARKLQGWKDDITPMLDVSRMKHPLTGDSVDPAELSGILDDIWQNVVTEGWHEREPSMMTFGRGALANQRAEHRFLVFKDADTWLTYQRDYGGGGDVFGSMMGHIEMMAKDIAALEILGPNPNGMVNWIKQAVTKNAQKKQAGMKSFSAAKPEKAMAQAKATEAHIDTVWASIRGELNTPVSTRAAAFFGGVRSLISASVMGSAALSSVSDIGTSIIARRFAGINSTGAFSDIVKAMSSATRQEAVAAGLILDSASHIFHSQARYVGTLDGHGWAAFINDRVLTLSGLTAWTQSAKHAFGLSFMHEAANQVSKSYDQLPDAFRNTFKRYGILPADWDKIRAAKLHDMGGAKILRPTDLGNTELISRYLEMIQSETQFAVPEGGHRTRRLLLGNTKPGTFWGEVLKSFAMFKSFGAVFAILHGLRVHNLIAGGQVAKGAAYAGSLLFSTTLFGALAMQLKATANGRDPRDMTDQKFWAGALLQGGGLGIYGDFFFGNLNRFGGGLQSTFSGPVIGRANDIWDLTAGNLVQLASHEKTHFGRELVKFARGNVPGSNIWYIKAAWERTVMDQLQFLADPEAAKAFKRAKQRYKKDYGQEFWWSPGNLTPDRAPDMSAMIK